MGDARQPACKPKLEQYAAVLLLLPSRCLQEEGDGGQGGKLQLFTGG